MPTVANKPRSIPVWTAAAAILLTIGLNMSVKQLFNPSNQEPEREVITALEKTESSSPPVSEPRVSDVIPPSVTDNLPQAQPSPTLPPLLAAEETWLPKPKIKPNKPIVNTSRVAKNNQTKPTLPSLPSPDFASTDNIFYEQNNIASPDVLTEVKNYFQQRWQPPVDLTQTLEYSLIFNNNGTINQIIPLGQAEEEYLEKTNIPLTKETIIYPSNTQDNITIRLVLNTNGTVQTFWEY